MKYYIIAGEASGDLHGSNLIREIKNLDPAAEFRCWGGAKMKEAGADLVKHYRELAFMGFAEVIKNLPTILRNLKFCKQDILDFQPDKLVLIDYPGFNLRISKWAKEQRDNKQLSSKIIFYISPQVWAWKENRVKEMKRSIDKMLVILPFEKDYFKNKWDWEVEYVGHPLVEEIRSWELGGRSIEQNSTVIALLPGSRRQEILKKLPVMLEVTKYFPDHQFVVARAPGTDDSFYNEQMKPYPNVSSVTGKTYELLQQSEAALVTSGTATLETALFGVPEAVCYKGSFLSYEIGRRVVNVKYISLVNLIMDRLVIKEFIQHDMTVENLRNELNELLHNGEYRERIKKDYAELKAILSAKGNASATAAKLIVSYKE
jgi:lipid-A-disaccharide synthase